jgi:ribosomal protein L11 methyltransferase
MKYLELVFSNTHPSFDNEILMAFLGELGFDSFTEDEGFLFAYIPEDLFSEESMLQFLGDNLSGKSLVYKINDVKEENWNAVWEKSFNDVVIPGRCRIRAPFHSPDPDYPLEILIEPKMSFGTAHHETTYMMMELILDIDFHGKKVLDMGSGTAILAVLAAKLGASDIVAIDNDDWAYRNAFENIALNNTNQIEVLLGDANTIPDIRFDVIFANINRNILLRDMHAYTKQLVPGGTLLLSGYYLHDQAPILEITDKLNLRKNRFLSKNTWVAEEFYLNT